jgi:hypothetical protein
VSCLGRGSETSCLVQLSTIQLSARSRPVARVYTCYPFVVPRPCAHILALPILNLISHLALLHSLALHSAALTSVTPRIFAVEFFFFSLLAKIRALPFLFLFPSLNLDLFQSFSGIRFGIPVCIKTLNTLCCLMHHAEPCISFDCFESANAFM